MKGLLQVDNTTIWADGSRTYPVGVNKAKDPPGTYPYPPPMGGIPVEVAAETPAQSPSSKLQAPTPGPVVRNPGPFPPGIEAKVIEVEPLPANASPADLWDRWQKLVINWTCLIAWGGGGLDQLTAAIGGSMPVYQNTGKAGNQTAIGAWRWVVTAGYDKATAPADLGKGLGIDANDVSALIGQLNDLGGLARAKGYKGCPPPPSQSPSAPPGPASPLDTAHTAIHSWWANLSPGGKVVTGVAALGVLGLIVRGAAK